ncbi:Bug family tripartite tricarboxylate transporter substrate binding protein [Hydrogenophaga laconesensis]|uniref:Tripartite-type tricarboxylate transporter receptor subunit TctC n=1 Tax=Hydrogenophaga laconesensis TaxID=1805971 RepID=A0ABU1VBB0_9BURK|nr:tripartite tricarboxylate transporter substrate binding protein [Hydrogenophaga laconesensis]MDR7094598.1 tripartite-type tricarboxylate transporter receptor subunit TctC [Hydrogenophaga laconesensis]
MINRRFLLAVIVGALGTSPAWAQQAQAAAQFPDKPIRLLLPFPPGGSSDQVARVLGPLMAEKLGQPVVIENRPGAGGAIALDAVARSAPDGYTLGVGTIGGLGLAKLMGQSQPYDALKDFAPVGMMITIPFVVVASNASRIESVADLVARARDTKGGLSVGHGGNGSQMHLSVELLRQMTQAELVSVPYRGTAPATQDVMGGQMPLAMSDTSTSIQQIKAGTLKAVGVTSGRRSPALPNVPTLAEQGLTGYESVGWIGIVAPARTPPEIIAKLNAALNAALNTKSARDTIQTSGSEPSPGTPQQLGQLILADHERWGKLIKAANIKIE